MRLYLSSVGIGTRPELLSGLVSGRRRVAVILNAYDFRDEQRRAASLAFEMDELRKIDLEPEEVDLRSYFTDASTLEATLRGFDALYVRGGNTFVLRRALALSTADQVITRLLAEDALVYSGYSAGICVLGPTLRGIDGHIDDPHYVPAGYPGGPPSYAGLGVLPYAIAPHYRSDHPESAEIEDMVRYLIDHHIPFITLRDGEAIVVDGDTTTVIAN
ncbi:Type 1 glutamine amidotransferase-like domain-containing protein [Winogradskya humida]|uniref:Dipeptidase E n=1 Tax=Winogradskya humida TaxID=113566 RepID=A0ABQ4A129_9ACTN|nr:Type 1 glutamine amidotransferase-like domain-containing protein [Actinoplanes humidus]GIE24537.1 hypothetical protein Ahu01nite_076390 [Actinoplanes humidus]